MEFFENEFDDSNRIKKMTIKPYADLKGIKIKVQTETALCIKVDIYPDQKECYGYIEPFYEFGKESFIIGNNKIQYTSANNNTWLINFIATRLYRELSCSL